MRVPFRIAAGLVFVVPLVGGAMRPKPPADPRLLPEAAVHHDLAYSNILPDDYVGPESCAGCHAQKHRLWSKHPHSRMNQLPGPDTVRGDFAGAELRLTNGTARFTTGDDAYRMTVTRGGQTLRRYRVTRTVGSRFIQFYIGVQTEGPEPAGHGVYQEHLLPFAWWMTLGRWLPKHYFDLIGPEQLAGGVPVEEGVDKIEDVRRWTTQCVSCHNTVPYVYRAAVPLFAGFPDSQVSLAVGTLSATLSPTLPTEPSVLSFEEIFTRIDPDRHLVTLGVSCESCHFGGREHASLGGKTAFLPSNPALRLTPRHPARPPAEGRKNPATLTGICTQCHAANVHLYPDGSAQCNSREGLDFSGGACTSRMTCVTCHEPHTAGPPSGATTNPAHVAACARCHDQYADPAAAAAHGRHPAAAGVNCLDCHMPRQVLGLDAVVRTHRVGPPVQEALAARGLANACNLCHLDRSLSWTLSELERGWGRRLTPRPAWDGYKDHDRPLGELWLRGPDTGMRLVAAQSYARSPLGKAALPDLIRALNDPEPVNRVFAARAVGQVRGAVLAPMEYDVTAPPAVRARQIEQLLAH
jgi:hypothetical protein